MRIISKSLIALCGAALALTGCSSDDLQGGANLRLEGETMPVSLTVTRPSDATRTLLSPSEDGGLASVWTAGDRLTVVSENGLLMGELVLERGEESDTGVFSGVLDGVAEGTKCRVYYLGASSDAAPAYTLADVAENGAVTLVTDFASDEERTVSGAFADLSRADLMEQEAVLSVYADGKASATENVAMTPRHAMARFSLSGMPTELSEDAVLTVSARKASEESEESGEPVNVLPYGKSGAELLCGEGYGYKVAAAIADGKTDLYLPFVPGEYALTFDLTDGDTHYAYTFTETATLEAGKYYATSTGGETGAGIAVPMEEQTSSVEPVVDEDVVGPVFEVNGKKFRFTRANLKYNTVTKEWSLMENQYSFLCQAGWTLSNGQDATGQKTPEEIDMYGFGATGLYDIESDETAQAPTFLRQTQSQSYSLAEYYYPTNNSTINQGTGFIGSNLDRPHGVQFTNFDWGKAYTLYKRNEAYPSAESPYTSYDNEGDRYFTLSSSDWIQLSTKYFLYGATITKANNGKDVLGMIILNVEGTPSEKQKKVEELIKDRVTYYVTPSVIGTLTGTSNSSFVCNRIKMTPEQFKALEDDGIIVFLPQAGHRAVTSMGKDDGYYWTATAGQQYTAYFLLFDGRTSGASSYRYMVKNYSRQTASCVRLVKEVKE